MANDIFSEQERASIFIPAGRTLLTLLSGQLNAAFKPSDFIMEDFLNIIGDIRPRVGQGLVEAEELARAFATSSVLLSVAGCILLQKAYPLIKGRGKKAFRLGCAAIGALACLSVAVEGWRCLLAHEAHREKEEIFSAARGRDVLVEPMPVRGNGYMVLGKYLSDIEADPDFWVNRGVAAHYHLASVALRQQVFNIMGVPGFSATLKGLSFAVRSDAPGAPPAGLHVYYYGTPGLLDCLPGFAGDFVYGWLAAGKDGDLRLLLVPILCARADIALDRSGQGRAKLFGLIDAAKGMWLVRPGAGSLSFDLLRLEAVPERD